MGRGRGRIGGRAYYNPGDQPQPHRPDRTKGLGRVESTKSAVERTAALELARQMAIVPPQLTRQQRRKLEREGRAPWAWDPTKATKGPK